MIGAGPAKQPRETRWLRGGCYEPVISRAVPIAPDDLSGVVDAHDGVDLTNDRASEYDRRHNETMIKSS